MPTNVRLTQVSIGDLAGGVQEPLAVPVYQVRFSLSVRAQPGHLGGRARERYPSQSAGDRPDRHSSLVELPGQASIVERLRGVRAEPDRPGFCLLPPSGSSTAQGPGADIRTQRCVSVGHLAGDVDRGLAVARPGFGVHLVALDRRDALTADGRLSI